jgi:non-heme chloroperoxidase
MPTPDFLQIAPDISLHLRDWGDGRPIVFIHGWPLSHEMWEYQFNALPQQGYRCVAVTLRGFGRSSQPWGEHNYDVWAADVQKVLAALDLRDAALVGFSMGGAIALRYAAAHNADARVTRLALCGAAAPCFTQRDGFPAGAPRDTVDGFLAACRSDRPKLLDDFGKTVFKSNSAGNAPIRAWLYSLAMQASPHATAAGLVALRDADLRDDMAQVNIPTLILHGPADKVCPFPLAEALAAGIAGAQLVRFESSGHALFYEQRDKFNHELASFVG